MVVIDPVQHPSEYVELMAGWVNRVVTLSGTDRITAWAEYTPIVRMVTAEAWQAARGAVESGEPVVGALRAGLEAKAAEAPRASSCFWHDLEDDGRQVRIHFANREGPGVLGSARRPQRLAELAATLDEAHCAAPQAERIRGGSWLYHLPGYRALFPSSFLARAIPAEPHTGVGRVALWGQFLRGDGTLYRPHADKFIEATRRASSMGELVEAFPLRRLDIVGPLDEVMEWLRGVRDS